MQSNLKNTKKKKNMTTYQQKLTAHIVMCVCVCVRRHEPTHKWGGDTDDHSTVTAESYQLTEKSVYGSFV